MRFIYYIIASLFIIACSNKEQPKAKPQKQYTHKKEIQIKPPVFKDKELSEYVKEYDVFMKEYIKAIQEGDESKIAVLQEQSKLLIERAKTASVKLKTPAQIQKYTEWLKLQQDKIATLNTTK